MENKQPKISILMCNYNNAHYIEKALDSVLSQTYNDWELSLLDDCSTDSSWEIIEKYAKKDPRIKIYKNEKNLGYGKSIAKNIEIANGFYGGILDPDDALAPNAIETMMKAFEENPEIVGAYSQLYFCDKDLNVEEIYKNTREIPENTTYLEYGNVAMTHFFVFDRKKFIAHGNVDSSYRNALDQDWYFKIEEIGKVKFIKEPLYYYRVSPTGLSQGKKKKYITSKDCLEIKKKAIARRNLNGKRKRLIINKHLSEMLYFKYAYLKSEGKFYAVFSLIESKFRGLLAKIKW